ncbi:glycosyltransferase [Pseudanabaenaceae cyanobacterium LEGE 13415]|nr:glycosyltransferase [Pseudanabaenaceae cyanobacterium LEGE 13415]
MKVSVVIPAYNAAHLLSDAIDSVLAQSFTDWELWIVDDGSTDHTQEVVNAYDDDRIKLISQSNRGVSSARNHGAIRSQGELIAFLDADDRWLPEKLSVHVEFMDSHPEVQVSFARVEFLTVEGVPTNKFTNCPLTNLSAADFFYLNPTVTTSNVVIRRELFEKLQGFDHTINYSEDIELLFRSMQNYGALIEGIDRVLVRYRVHNTGLSSTLYRMEEGWHKLIEKARLMNPELVDRHYASAYASYLQYLARQTLRLKSPASIGVDFVNRAFKSDRTFILKQPKFLFVSIVVYLKFFLSQLKTANDY